MLIGWFINMNNLAPLVRSDSLEVHPIGSKDPGTQVSDAQGPPPSARAEAPT